MREFKFRAWHKGSYQGFKEMLCSPQMIEETLHPGDVFRWKNEGQNLIIMQYTGYKDQKGVDIYESDIWKRNQTICVVEFKNAQWVLEYYKGHIQYPYFHSNIHYGEIIGNIHENPELLKEAK